MAATRTITAVFIVMLAVNGWPQSPHGRDDSPRAKSGFDGRWWLRADREERAGFIEGGADCLTWTAHEKGFSGTSQELEPRISQFYKAHPENAGVAVLDVWKRLAESSTKPSNTPEPGAEIWNNPHWYLNGDWWGSVSLLEDKGFLEGYLSCTDNRVVPKTESYSQSVGFYQRRIDSYIDAHPNSGSEPVAAILRRFRDKDGKANAKQAR
jgi:hypothetical protein